ncbi:MAG: hypothetical protein JSS81_05505 [Acidobacteria bacterium]|nr:hypothetical protein [Acidobacteriota bacterium]
MSNKNKVSDDITIWKFGCNWGGRQNPNFYEFIQEEKIVIGRERFRYAEGDLVLITDGFTVKAIVKVLEEPASITTNSKYRVLADTYNVAWDNRTIFAKADWYELPENLIFQYLAQRGSGRVRKREIKEIALNLWNERKV